ncbi:unnamed protein product, partial [Brassica oleracea]
LSRELSRRHVALRLETQRFIKREIVWALASHAAHSSVLMAAEPPLSERCDNFLGRSSKDSDMVEIAPPAFASGSTTLEIQKETALLKLGSVGFHGGNVIVDRNDINR